MRVISGIYRSRVLEEVPSTTTRETRDRVKESFFGTIHFECFKATVLDLFCGSGSLGIEALSRGANYCDFVDMNPQAIKTVKTNIKNLQCEDSTTVSQMDYLSFLNHTDRVYDLIFLDPPYQTYDLLEMINIIEKKKLLSEDGIIVLLTHKSQMINLDKYDIISYKSKEKGITKIQFLKWSD